MNLFNPRTFSTDWEVMVVDKLERCVDTDKLMAFAGVLAQELDLPVQIDWMTLEFALGINTSFEQLWQRIQVVTDRAAQLVAEYDCDLFPASAHPRERLFNAAHIHVGTLYDESSGIHLENQLLPYVPVFGALAANSPLAQERRGECKSYRIRNLANGEIRPGLVRDPQMSQVVWAGEASPKLFGAPTLEVRITDAASSRRFLAELATFVAAYVHYQGTRIQPYSLAPDDYRDQLTNRWTAARDGLQATFHWRGERRPVVDILDEMLDECHAALSLLGVTRNALPLIATMLKKRTCQADLAIHLAQRYPDAWCLTSAYAKLVRHWEVFDEYLTTAPVLEPVPAPDAAAIAQVHLNNIGEGTHFYRSRETMHYPPPVADALIEQLIAEGRLHREVTAERGVLFHRLAEPV